MGTVVAGQDFVLPELDPRREPEDIIAEALAFAPRACFVGFSGGDDSLAVTHWMMTHVPGCKVLHINTGIGIEKTRVHVRETCSRFGWPLVEIRAKEDCGQDYRDIVLEHGFAGPPMHRRMYQRLKERCVEKLVRDHKRERLDKILIATGIRQDESIIRMGYGDRVVNTKGSQLWVSPLYWWPKERFMAYIAEHRLPRNPVSEILGMSGECLCGAYAHKGEKALVRIVCPETAAYLDRLEAEVRAAGHDWGWEDRPPTALEGPSLFDLLDMPLCRGCEKVGTPQEAQGNE